MAVGPRDIIDQLLVKKYNDEKVDNPDIAVVVDAQKMMSAMNDYSSMAKNFLLLQNKLSSACAAINSKSIQYRCSRFATA